MDFGSGLSGAADGALAGSSAGPFGAIAGGLLGGITGLFTEPQKLQEYHDPFQVAMHGQIDKLLSSDLGAKTAQQESAVEKRGANEQYQKYAANPDFAKNPALMAAAYNSVQNSGEQRGISAQLAGAREDQGTREQGLQLQNQEANRSFEIGRYNNTIDQQNNQPGFFQSMLMSTLGQAGGIGLGKLLGGQSGGQQSGGDQASMNLTNALNNKLPGLPSGGSVDSSTTNWMMNQFNGGSGGGNGGMSLPTGGG